MEKEEWKNKISEGVKRAWDRKKEKSGEKIRKQRSRMSAIDTLEMIVLSRTGAYTYQDLGKKYNCTPNVASLTVRNNIYKEEEIQNALTSYKFKVLKELEKVTLKDTSLRQEIVRKGLFKLNKIITYNDDIQADKLSTVISQIQKDLWTSLGQPSEISQTQQISDELLNTLINKMENQNEQREHIEPIVKQLPREREGIDDGGEGEIIISSQDGEGEETQGMET